MTTGIATIGAFVEAFNRKDVDRIMSFFTEDAVLPVMGAFDLRDGKIAAWRDYFDMATWRRQMDG